MYLIKLVFNNYNQHSLKALMDCNEMHKVLWNLFPDSTKENRFQWFLANDTVLVRSFELPKCSSKFAETYLSQAPRIIQTEAFEENAFEPGTEGMIKIRVNPVKRKKGKVANFIPADEFNQWISELLFKNGFYLYPDTLRIENSFTDTFNHNGTKSRIYTKDICAKVCIQDKSKALNAYRNGIGRKKGFGYGMLMYSV